MTSDAYILRNIRKQIAITQLEMAHYLKVSRSLIALIGLVNIFYHYREPARYELPKR